MADSFSSSSFMPSSTPDLNDNVHLNMLARQKIFYDALYEGRKVLLRAAESQHVRELRAKRARRAREAEARRRMEDAEFARLVEEDRRKAQAAHWRAQEEEFARLLEEDVRRAQEAHRRALAEEAARREEEERRAEERRRRKAEEKLRRRFERQERERIEEERRRLEQEFMRFQAVAEAARAQQEVNALHAYEQNWETLREKSPVPLPPCLGFGDIPWPVFGTVRSVEDITQQSVGEFVFHAQRVSLQGASKAKIIRQELLRWHSDKFHWQILGKVIEADREAVKEVAEHVACILGDLT
jgi:hypothetical protein